MTRAGKHGSAGEEAQTGSNVALVHVTSLNSGFSVFFFTAVLCFDFLFSSGFRYLRETEKGCEQEVVGHFWEYVLYSYQLCPVEGAVAQPWCQT